MQIIFGRVASRFVHQHCSASEPALTEPWSFSHSKGQWNEKRKHKSVVKSCSGNTPAWYTGAQKNQANKGRRSGEWPKLKTLCWEVTLTESEPLLENSSDTKTHLSVPTYLTGLVHTNQLCKIWQHSPEPWHLKKFPLNQEGRGRRKDLLLVYPIICPMYTCLKFTEKKSLSRKREQNLIPV